jgi:repressor of nif and glnA expression
MREKTEEKRLAILRILREAGTPLGSSKITERLAAMGHDISERTVRFHLLDMDAAGLTENLGRGGRAITERGLKELSQARAFEKVGYLSAKIDQMTYRMNFDLGSKSGTVVINLSLIERAQIDRAVPLLSRVFAAGYAMGKLIALFSPGEHIGETTIPEGSVGIGTVCSITVNGVLVAHGIPTNSRFGGLLELRDRKPTRFVELIHYEGTTIDPLEAFIRSGMTDYVGATSTGNGLIGASFREVPADARDRVIELADQMSKAGLGGVFLVGWPGRPLLEIPVSEGRLGVVVIGGLNPVAMLEEQGMRIRHTGALAGLIDYWRLFPYEELGARVRELN